MDKVGKKRPTYLSGYIHEDNGMKKLFEGEIGSELNDVWDTIDGYKLLFLSTDEREIALKLLLINKLADISDKLELIAKEIRCRPLL